MNSGFNIKNLKTAVLYILLLAITILSAVIGLETRTTKAAESGNTPVVTVDEKTAHRGQTFTVDVNLSQNDGLISLYLTLEYDNSAMKLTEVTRGEALESLTYTNTNTQTSLGYDIIPFNMLWDGRASDNTNGQLVRLTFESFSTAAVGRYPITLKYDAENTNSEYGTPIAIEVKSGGVTLTEGEFKAIYYDWNGEELYKKDYNADEVPSYMGETPKRAADEYYSYEFIGWKGLVSDDENTVKYQADYRYIATEYEVFYYVDGMNSESFDGKVTTDDYYTAKEVGYGEYLENEYPIKPRYVFSGWYTDSECSEPFIETTMPAKNIAL